MKNSIEGKGTSLPHKLYQHWDETVAQTPDDVLVVVLELSDDFLPDDFFQQLIEICVRKHV